MLSRISLLFLLIVSTVAGQNVTRPAGQTPTPATPGLSSSIVQSAIRVGGGLGPQVADNCAVVPIAYANAWANSYGRRTNTPFSSAPMHYQQVFLGSELPGGFTMIGLRLRRDDWLGRSNVGYVVNLEINIGFTSMTPATLTSTFAANFNRGAPVNVLRRSNVTLPNMPSTSASDPTVFFVKIPFTTPFPWPASGGGLNLLVEVINRGNSNNNAAFPYYLDMAAGSSQFPVKTAKVYGTSPKGTVARNSGLVMCFDGAGTAATDTHYGAGCEGTGGVAGSAVPAAIAKSFGTGNNLYPFAYSSFKYQQVFLAKEISPKTTPITALRLRQDEFFGGHASVTKDLEINIGFTTRSPATLTTTFASNFDSGTPINVLPRQSLKLPPMPLTLPSDPTFFNWRIPFKTPFAWSPAKGNLLIQITIRGGGSITALDAGYGNTARLYARSSTALTGAIDSGRNYGLAMFFESSGRGPAVPWLTGVGRPVIGSSFNTTLVRALPSTPALLLVGTSNSKWGTIPLPFDMTNLGAPTCFLRTSPDIGIFPFVTNATGMLSVPISLPNSPSLVSLHLYMQFAAFDGTANPLGLTFSRGSDARIGNF